MLAWYLHTVDAVAHMVSPHRYKVPLAPPPAGLRAAEFPSLDEALNWCEVERTNLVAATRQAAASGLHVLAWQLPVAAFGFFNRRTYWADWVETHQIALASVRVLGDRRGEALVLNNLGMAYARRRMDEAAGYFEQALAHPPRDRGPAGRSADRHQPGRYLPAAAALRRGTRSAQAGP